ncbi:ABC transporter permease [Candidatus Bathyarchaeota archaeon]|nr:ABC transporter permease [Candidatus Bathyarchaeota archaeon]
MSKKSTMPFWLVRFKNFMLLLLKNKLAAVGLFLMALFIIMAVAAPLLTPYSPFQPVTGKYYPPTWITLIKGPVGYSQNTHFSALTVNASGLATIANVQTHSADLTFQNSPTGTVWIVETLNYPYQGSPISFSGLATINVASINSPFTVTAFVDRIGVSRFPVWLPTQVNTTGQFGPNPRIDSSTGPFNQQLGIAPEFSSAGYVFAAEKAAYKYVLQISVPSGFTGQIQVKDLEMNLTGNTWGILGTDWQGEDVYTQVVYGARLSLLVGLVATSLGIGIGLLIGLMAGYLGKIVDEVLMRTADMLLVIPFLPLLIVLVATIGASLLYVMILIGIFSWMGFARIVRSQVLSLRERPFIEAAKASGAGTGYITVRHIFPNIVSLTYVNLALTVPAAIVTEAALSFLGLSDSTVVTWGSMLGTANEQGATVSNIAWWWILPPGLSIALISLAFILIGYALDELFNPRLRRRR